MLATVARNLWANAVKFSETGDRIAITATTDFGEVALEVADTGVGMTEEQIAALFAPAAARSIDGTAGERGAGLGLLLCDEFVRRHEGRIEVRSTPGEGSVFRVVLPACGLAAAV
jgi:signal transduction histidine kinase